MSASVPPPIPPRPPPLIHPSRPPATALNLAGIDGAAGLSITEIREAVAQGGRFVVFQYCFSVIVLSFKHSSSITFIKPGESAFVKGLSYSLISLFAGWWGIPWGPIWTIMTLATNLGGGKDMTREVVAALGLPPTMPGGVPPVSPVVTAERESRKTMILRLAWAIVVVMFLGMGWIGYKIYSAGRNLPPQPGATEFRAANANLGATGVGASGNSSGAIELASQMSRAMQAVRDQNFEQAKKKSFMDARDTFRTYCELREDKCVFLVHVPELRRFNSDAQQTLGQMAWLTAQGLLQKSGAGKSGMGLAVGLRGLAAYDRVLTGKYLPDAGDANMGILGTREDFGCERELQTWFAAKPQPANEAAFELISQTNGTGVK